MIRRRFLSPEGRRTGGVNAIEDDARAMAAANLAARDRAIAQQRQSQQDALDIPLKQAQLTEAQRKAADAAIAAKEPLYQGQGPNIQDFHILHYRDPTSSEYREAYARQARPQVGEGGLIIKPNMEAYRTPLDADGVPITTLDQSHITIGPGNLTELRKMETQAAGLKSALDDFASTAKNASLTEKAATIAGASTDLRSAWTNAGLMAKGEALFNLGVLSGPDMSVIRGALADPSTFWGGMASSSTIDKQVGRIKQLLETRIDQARRSYGGGMSAGGPAGDSKTPPASTPPALPSVPAPPKGFKVVQ